jgi:hypothetical protein
MKPISLAEKRRNNKGVSIAEFAPAFALLIVCGIIPLFASLIIPVRIFFAQGLLDRESLSLCRYEKMSDATQKFGEKSWQSVLAQLGIKTTEKQLNLLITNTGGHTIAVEQPAKVSHDWLPGGQMSPSIYRLQVLTKMEMPPVLSCSVVSIPGLTRKLNLTLKSESLWQNLSCDPETNDYFLNE